MKYLTLNNDKNRFFYYFEQKTKFNELPIVIIDHMDLITNSAIDKHKIERLNNEINKNIKI